SQQQQRRNPGPHVHQLNKPHCVSSGGSKRTRPTYCRPPRLTIDDGRSPIYRDQFGYQLLPVRVICVSPLPSRAIVKICTFPARVEVKARCRPFGANAGLSLLPSPFVSWWLVCLATS